MARTPEKSTFGGKPDDFGGINRIFHEAKDFFTFLLEVLSSDEARFYFSVVTEELKRRNSASVSTGEAFQYLANECRDDTKTKILSKAERLTREKFNLTQEDIRGNFYTLFQNRELNALIRLNFNHPEQLEIDTLGTAVIRMGDSFLFRLKEYKSLKKGLTTQARMLLDCLVIAFTQSAQKDIRIRLPLRKYMQMRGLSDEKEARAQVLEGMEVLKRLEYTAYEKIGGKWKPGGSISLYGGTGYIKSGIICFNFNADFYGALMKSKVMDYSKETLQINPRQNPHAYNISRYIDENYRINEGKERLNIISVSQMLSVCPGLPNPDTTREKYKLIVCPVIRDMDSLERVYYDFIDPDGQVIDYPLEHFKGRGGWVRFMESRIQLDYSGYPSHKKRTERHAKHINIAAAKKE